MGTALFSLITLWAVVAASPMPQVVARVPVNLLVEVLQCKHNGTFPFYLSRFLSSSW